MNHHNKTNTPQVLGQAQIDWLIQALRKSRAPFKFVCIGGQVLNDAAVYENVSQFPSERQQILDRLEEEDIRGVVFLSGDRHTTELSEMTLDNGRKVYDLTVSPLTSGPGHAREEGNTLRVDGTYVEQRNYAKLSFEGPRKDRVAPLRSKTLLERRCGPELWVNEPAQQNRLHEGALNLGAVAEQPWALLEAVGEEAVDAGISDPTAFTLNTVDAEGFPHGRVVLLRDTRREQLVFFTNYRSEKGQDVERLGRAGATFFWPHAERQIRVRGHVERVPEAESDAYFSSRPRASQLGAWSSNQSQPASTRQVLEDQYSQRDKEVDGQTVPRPAHWGGYALTPEVIEFWQGRASRMHDRIVCTRGAGAHGAWCGSSPDSVVDPNHESLEVGPSG